MSPNPFAAFTDTQLRYFNNLVGVAYSEGQGTSGDRADDTRTDLLLADELRKRNIDISPWWLQQGGR